MTAILSFVNSNFDSYESVKRDENGMRELVKKLEKKSLLSCYLILWKPIFRISIQQGKI